VTFSLFGHHAKTMAFNSSLKYEIRKEWKNDGLGKIALQTKVPHTLYKGTHE
jgi:peptidyl-tRNA hydrolase